MGGERRVLRACIAGASLAALIDAMRITMQPYGGDRVVLHLFAVSTTVLAGGLLGFLLDAWTSFVSNRWPSGPYAKRGARLSLPLIAFFWWVPSSWIVEHHAAFGLSSWLLVAAVALMSIVAAVALTSCVLWWTDQGPHRLRDGAALVVCLVAAAGFFWLDATFLVDLYPDFHIGLACAFVGAITCAAALASRVSGLGASYPKKVDAWYLLGAFTLLASVSVAFPWGYSHSGSLLFSKLESLAQGLRPDDQIEPLSHDGSIEEPSRYPVPACDDCNVLLLSIDAVRADHVGAYGYDRNTTPHLDELARSSLLFERAYSQATKTFDSLPSIHSGVYPSQLDRNYEHPRLENAKSYVFFVAEGTTFLSERFRKIGYQTGAFYRFRFGDFGYHRGYDEVVEREAGLTEAILRFIRQAKSPFFAVVHYGYPHEPYVGHAGYHFGKKPIDRYDSEIAFSDAELGKILSFLKKQKLLEKTIVIVTSDHGEEFGEHGGKFHTRKLHEELLHVPLVVRIPGVASSRVDDIVELVDIAPLLNEVLGLGARDDEFVGQSLLAARYGARRSQLSGGYSEDFQRKGLVAASLVTAEWRGTWKKKERAFELYDRKKDPSEQEDVSLAHPEIVRALKARLVSRSVRDEKGSSD